MRNNRIRRTIATLVAAGAAVAVILIGATAGAGTATAADDWPGTGCCIGQPY